MALTIYNKKRDFKQTSEPVGKVSKESKLRFVYSAIMHRTYIMISAWKWAVH